MTTPGTPSVNYENLSTERPDGTDSQTSNNGGDQPTKAKMSAYFQAARGSFHRSIKEIHKDNKKFAKELKTECYEVFDVYESLRFLRENWASSIFIPYIPALHKPGWLLRYAVGPYNSELFQCFISDFFAGLTVALTLIPQALSYATLANLPPINGLYTAIIPAATYTFFGSSMQLCVGPVALVSLLIAQLINKYGIDYTNNPEEAVDFASEAAIAVGVILTAMSIFNLGNLIRLISHPVMSGFTTAAACIIGINQLKSAFGFTLSVPQVGQEGYEFNFEVMQWFIDHWNDHYEFTQTQLNNKPSLYAQLGRSVRNPFAAKICFGLFVPLIFIQLLKGYIKATPERKKTIWYNLWFIFSSLSSFIAIIIGAHVAYEIKKSDGFNDPSVSHEWYKKKLSIVGIVTPGLDFIRLPSMKWDFATLLGDVFPTALIAFMESYSVANKIAIIRNELHILNASQELWAVGVANLLAGISSSYPIAGSFSRSSLNCATGARTPLSKAINMIIVILALQYLTKTFQYIPSAALAAVIWSAIFNLVSFSDFWHAWKHSKKDFFVMLVTTAVVFIFDTGVGLAAGIGVSLLAFLIDEIFNPENAPSILDFDESHRNGDVIHILIKGDLNFLTIGKLVDKMTFYTMLKLDAQDMEFDSWNEKTFFQVSSAFDYFLQPRTIEGIQKLPKAIIIDFSYVRVTDLTAMMAIEEVTKTIRSKGIKVAMVNTTPYLAETFLKFEFKNDDLKNIVNHALYTVYFDQSGEIIPKNVSKDCLSALAELENEDDDDDIESKEKSSHGYNSIPTSNIEITIQEQPLSDESLPTIRSQGETQV